MLLHGKDDAIAYDGEQNEILERGPFDHRLSIAADEVVLSEDEQ